MRYIIWIVKMKSIAIEDLATVFAGEFFKEISYRNRSLGRMLKQDFLKMNYMRRRKLIEKVLDKMERNIYEN